MTQATVGFTSFEEYLDTDIQMEGLYELIDGELVQLPTESELNTAIAQYLFLQLVSSGVPFRLIKLYQCEIEVPKIKPKDPLNRYPDLVVLRPEHLAFTQKRLTIRLDMPAPQLIVEVVSPGQTNRERDYVRKRDQYAAASLPEYWLIDPEQQCITVLTLEDGHYQEVGIFQGRDRVVSLEFPELVIIADLLLAAGGSIA